MQPRSLDTWEKEWIRSEVQAALRSGKTNEEIKRIRRALAETLECSPAQVNAVSAWKATGTQLSLQSSAKFQQEDQGEGADLKDGDAVAEQSEAESGGEHMDYDFAAKRKWRSKWAEFIAEHTSREERGKMKVLCLPGKKCLEIPLYLDLGFLPENILGVEGGDRSAREEFAQNAQRYGIKYELKRLEALLAESDNRYDIVSLDFHGMCSDPHFRIVRDLRVSEKSLLLINQQAKREKVRQQYLMKVYKSSRSALPGTNIEDWYEVVEQPSPEDPGFTPLKDGELPDLRSEAVTDMMLRNLGGNDPRNIRFPELSSQLYAAGRNVNKARHIFLQNVRDFFLAEGYKQEAAASSAFFTKFMMDCAFHGANMPTNLEQYEYKNPNNSPFHSAFIAIRSGHREIQQSRYSLSFFLECTAKIIEQMKAGTYVSSGFHVRDKHMSRLRKDRDTVFPSDHLCFQVNGQLQCSTRWREYRKGLESCLSLYENQIFEEEFAIRKEITEDS